MIATLLDRDHNKDILKRLFDTSTVKNENRSHIPVKKRVYNLRQKSNRISTLIGDVPQLQIHLPYLYVTQTNN